MDRLHSCAGQQYSRAQDCVVAGAAIRLSLSLQSRRLPGRSGLALYRGCRTDATIEGMSTVLIIDDDAGFRVQVKALLVADGFAVAGEAEDGWSGLEAARSLRPDYVLLDLGLPDVDGFEVADALAGDQEPPIVVLTSGREASDFGPRLTKARAAGFIPKEELSGSAIRTLGEG